MSRDPMRRIPAQQSHSRDASRFANSVLFGDSAGVLLSGDSGSGKSHTMKLLAQHIINSHCGLTFISPHGDDPEDLERFCASLT